MTPLTIPCFAIILGAMKCGTTSLFGHLAKHPEVAASRPKEVEFFLQDRRWAKGFGWYERRFRWRAGHTIALEASTSYTKPIMFPRGFQRISAWDGDVRFIYMVRDPIRRIESQMGHTLSNLTPVRDYDDAKAWHYMLSISDYHAMLEPYRQRWGRDRILVLRLEDLNRRPAETLAETCRFIGVDPTFAFPDPAKARNRREDKVRMVRPSLNRVYSRMRAGPMRTAVEGAVKAVRPVPGLRSLAFGAPAEPRLAADRRDEARRTLAPAMRRFRDTYGVDVSAWGF